MPDAIQNWITALDQSKISQNPQPLVSTVDIAVAALNEIEGAIGPGSVSSVTNVDGTLTISPTTGAVIASANVTKLLNIGTVVSSATPTPASTNTQFNITALAVGATIAAPTGSPTDGQKLLIRIKDNGSAQSLAWNAIYRVITGITLPTVTLGTSLPLYVGCIYNAQDSTWDVVAAS